MPSHLGRRFVGCVLLAALGACDSQSTGGQPEATGDVIHLIVEPRLSGPLQSSLDRLASDLRSDGWKVSMDATLPADTPPERLRASLRERWSVARSLRGVILIGEYRAPLFNVKDRQGDPYWHDHLADLYYMDLNGAWADSDGDGVLDVHRSYDGELWGRALSWLAKRLLFSLDRRGPEIWLSRLRAGTLAPFGDELTLYRDYFDRNHAYRSQGQAFLSPRAFVLSAGVRLTTSGWGARPGKLYSDVAVTECASNSSEVLRKHLADPKGWALGVIGSFSGPQAHKLHYYEGGGVDGTWFKDREGRKLLADYSLSEHAPWDVTSREIVALRPKILFYQLLSSETGRHDQSGYLAGAYLFFGSGLAVIAGTQHSGATGVPVFYDHLERRESIGEAWRAALEWSLKNSRAGLQLHWCDSSDPYDPSIDAYKAVLLGDGTLRLPSVQPPPVH